MELNHAKRTIRQATFSPINDRDGVPTRPDLGERIASARETIRSWIERGKEQQCTAFAEEILDAVEKRRAQTAGAGDRAEQGGRLAPENAVRITIHTAAGLLVIAQ